MFLSRNYASCLALGALIAAPLTPSGVEAGDYVAGTPVERIVDHCAQFGQGFVDVGGGICGRVSGHVRVYVGTRNAAMNPWSTSGTSSAALRSDGLEVEHQRVHGGLDAFNPFR